MARHTLGFWMRYLKSLGIKNELPKSKKILLIKFASRFITAEYISFYKEIVC